MCTHAVGLCISSHFTCLAYTAPVSTGNCFLAKHTCGRATAALTTSTRSIHHTENKPACQTDGIFFRRRLQNYQLGFKTSGQRQSNLGNTASNLQEKSGRNLISSLGPQMSSFGPNRTSFRSACLHSEGAWLTLTDWLTPTLQDHISQ